MISNRFFVSALDDGTTLHGNLSVNGSLSQAWNGEAATPDWSTTDQNVGKASQPTIMLTLLSGATYIDVNNLTEVKWFYNNSEISFEQNDTTITWTDNDSPSGTQRSVIGKKSTDGRFLKHTGSLNGIGVPCLRIIQNLASTTNVDVDTIMLQGKYDSGSGILDFTTTTQIRISLVAKGGYLGVISFANGISDITAKDQTITTTGTLYGSADHNPVSCKTAWYLNEVSLSGRGKDDLKDPANTISVAESEVVDYALVRCDFYVTKDNSDTLVASAYASIDDMQDPEMMYIQYNGANGNAASLRKNKTATFDIWIGKNNDPTVDTSYVEYQVKLLNGSGNVILTSYSGAGIPNVLSSDPQSDNYGWRKLTISQTTGKASIPITYTVVDENGKNITGLVRASTTALS